VRVSPAKAKHISIEVKVEFFSTYWASWLHSHIDLWHKPLFVENWPITQKRYWTLLLLTSFHRAVYWSVHHCWLNVTTKNQAAQLQRS